MASPAAIRKAAVVPIGRGDWDRWLTGTIEEAQGLIGLPNLECIRFEAADPAKTMTLPLFSQT
jgi:hypothetical protein